MDAESLARQRERYAEALENSLKRLVVELSSIQEVELVVLFGSYAAGRRDLFTDLDLLVVMDSDLNFVTRTAELYRRLPTEVDVDLIVYTPQEVLDNRERPFLRRILEKGRVLYEKRAS
jgi:predicted nucleotidyltransferase